MTKSLVVGIFRYNNNRMEIDDDRQKMDEARPWTMQAWISFCWTDIAFLS